MSATISNIESSLSSRIDNLETQVNEMKNILNNLQKEIQSPQIESNVQKEIQSPQIESNVQKESSGKDGPSPQTPITIDEISIKMNPNCVRFYNFPEKGKERKFVISNGDTYNINGIEYVVVLRILDKNAVHFSITFLNKVDKTIYMGYGEQSDSINTIDRYFLSHINSDNLDTNLKNFKNFIIEKLSKSPVSGGRSARRNKKKFKKSRKSRKSRK